MLPMKPLPRQAVAATPTAAALQCPVCESLDTCFFMQVQQRDYLECRICGACFLDPAQRLSTTAELAHYQTHRNDPDDPAYRRFLQPLVESLLQRLGPRQRGLDYGCGPGPALAAMLREAGHEVVLYDPYFAPAHDALHGRYDFITCTEVAEHFRHPAAEFRQLDRLLKPGGWLAVMTGLLTAETDFSTWHYRRDPTHVVFYRPDTLRFLAQRYDWEYTQPTPNVVLLRKSTGITLPADAG